MSLSQEKRDNSLVQRHRVFVVVVMVTGAFSTFFTEQMQKYKQSLLTLSCRLAAVLRKISANVNAQEFVGSDG